MLELSSSVSLVLSLASLALVSVKGHLTWVSSLRTMAYRSMPWRILLSVLPNPIPLPIFHPAQPSSSTVLFVSHKHVPTGCLPKTSAQMPPGSGQSSTLFRSGIGQGLVLRNGTHVCE